MIMLCDPKVLQFAIEWCIFLKPVTVSDTLINHALYGFLSCLHHVRKPVSGQVLDSCTLPCSWTMMVMEHSHGSYYYFKLCL